MKIAICDDVLECVHDIRNILLKYFKERSNTIPELFEFQSGIELLQTFCPSKFDIIFLDIDMPELSGMELAGHIRVLDVNVQIVFVTFMEDQLPLGYDVMAAGFILKPPTQERIGIIIDRIISIERQRRNDSYEIQLKGGGKIMLPLRDTLYIESLQHYMVAHTSNTEYEFLAKISDEEVSLAPHGFLRIHRSFLANMAYFWIRKDNYIKLTNGKKLTIGRKYSNVVKEAYRKYERGGH